MEPDDERFGAAPLPPHERGWRHPSEIGEIAWQRTEPPLTIGRGLLFTAGTIGGLLALAVLWTALPTGAGSSVAAVSTQSARAAVAVTTSASSGLAGGEGPFGPVPGTLRATAHSFAPTQIDGAGPPAAATPTTLHLSASPSVERTAVAVLVGATPVIITTAAAIDPDDVVTLTADDGALQTARVMLTYHGVAVLEPDNMIGSTPLLLGSPTHAGDVVTVVGSAAVAVPLGRRSDGGVRIEEWGGSDAPEGAPVINSAGELVGLCRHAATGPEMVVVDADALRGMVSAAMSGAKEVWATTATTRRGGAPPATVPGSPTITAAPSTSPISRPDDASTSSSTSATTTTTSTKGSGPSTATVPTQPAGPRQGGWLGIRLDANAGAATIVGLEPDGPAATADLRVGDTILSVDATPTLTAADLAGLLAARSPGDTVHVDVRRAAPVGAPAPTVVTRVSLVVTLAAPPTAT